jgi:pyrroloquinoline quinone (PQQ) biosynthesis protein C
MSIVPLDSAWSGFIDPAWVAALDATPFLTKCRNGTVSRRELHSYVRQQHFYSRHFTRFLCALMARVGDDDRLALTQNLFEEMGLGDFGSVPHSAIYRSMMTAMGVDPHEEFENTSTTRLTEIMFESAGDVDPLVGLAALGLGAEAIVPHLYSQIVRGFESAGEPSRHLEFFVIHIEGDDEHAVTMRNIIERETAKAPGKLTVVRSAAARVIAARTAFFQEIPFAVRVPSPAEGASHVQL